MPISAEAQKQVKEISLLEIGSRRGEFWDDPAVLLKGIGGDLA